jgi:hypothetical protein
MSRLAADLSYEFVSRGITRARRDDSVVSQQRLVEVGHRPQQCEGELIEAVGTGDQQPSVTRGAS